MYSVLENKMFQIELEKGPEKLTCTLLELVAGLVPKLLSYVGRLGC